MKLVFTTIACMFLFAVTAQKTTSKAIAPLQKKLTGTWIMKKKNGSIMGETWLKKDNNSMSGKSFMVQNGDTAILETVELIKEGNDIYYIPVAYGQNDDKPVRFKLTFSKSGAYIFENPEHDFPKRIVYHFTANNLLHAYIDDGTNGKRQHYYYKKEK